MNAGIRFERAPPNNGMELTVNIPRFSRHESLTETEKEHAEIVGALESTTLQGVHKD